jgi:excinuclease ABC subunit C
MYYHIGRCGAPCVGKVTEAEYAQSVDEVKKLLSGETADLIASLGRRMADASIALRFEEAARLRDAMAAIELFAGKANAVDFDPEARDYIAWAADGDLIVFVVFQMRGGKLTGRDLFRSRLAEGEVEALSSFLMGYYDRSRPPPPRVFIQKKLVKDKIEDGEDTGVAAEPGITYGVSDGDNPHSGLPPPATSPEGGADDFSALSLVTEYFSRELSATTEFSFPAERRHEVAVNLAAQNAREELVKRRRELGDIPGLEALKAVLGLESLPERIEGFDIAQLSGKHTVASLVSFRNGVPDKKNYRYFKIKSLEGAIDDFGSIREAVARRYTKLVNEEAELPDLILVDGGAGQVSAAKEILDALGVDSELAGLAKENEEIWRPGAAEPIVLVKDSPALRVLVAVRDETHRFATGLNQRLRASELKFGVLEAVPGVGEARSRRLMRVFGSLDLIAGSTAERVAESGGMPIEVAQRVIEAAKRALDGKGGD